MNGIALVKWDQPDPGGAPVSTARTGVLLEFFSLGSRQGRTYGVVMADGGFIEVPIGLLRFVSWSN